MTKWWHYVSLVLILLLAASLRLTGLDWDNYEHYHPDERYITWVATTIDLPDDWSDAFDPDETSFNPFYWPADAESEGIAVPEDEPRKFAYGHLPLYLGVAATKIVEYAAPEIQNRLPDYVPDNWLLTRDLLNQRDAIEFRHLTAVTRALTGLIDVATVFLTFLLARRLYGVVAGLLAAAFLAVNVMHIQLAHFFAVDPYLTLFTVAALYFIVLLMTAAEENRLTWPYLWFAAAAIGLAVGSKFSAVILLLPLFIALWLNSRVGEGRLTLKLIVAILVAAGVFVVTNPFAVLDMSCEVITPKMRLGPLSVPALDWRSCYLDNIARQNAMVRGDDSFPFTRQYAGTQPFLYPVMMQVRWGMGPFLGVVAFTGFLWALWRGLRILLAMRWDRRPLAQRGWHTAELALLAWTIPYFVVTGNFYVKFMRYMQPLTPFLMVYGAALLLAIPYRRLRRLAVATVLVTTAFYAVSFVNMYRTPHPWIEASRWIYRNVPRGSLILSEQWDDPLPSSVSVDGKFRRRQEYEIKDIDWLTKAGKGDNVEKLKVNLSLLAQADYVTLSSNRGYAVIPRLPSLYPLSSQYYQLLFSGELGFEPVYVTGRSPRLGALHLWPERFDGSGVEPPPFVVSYLESRPMLTWGVADESFTVYDQPMPILFKNTANMSVEEMLQKFELE